MSSPAASIQSAADELGALARLSYYIGNAGDEKVERMVNGHSYRWAPLQRLEIKDQLDFPRDQKTQKANMRAAPIPIPTMNAFNVVTRIFSEDDGFKGGEAGLYIVRNDGRDGAREAMARGKYVEARCARARYGQKAWAARCDAWQPGDPVLVCPQALKEDIAFLAAQESGIGNRKAFWSKFGDFESDSREEVINHLRAMWPVQFSSQGDSLVISRDTLIARPKPAVTAPAAPKPAAPTVGADLEAMQPTEVVTAAPAVDKDQVKYILKQAADLGTSLTDEEMDALLSGDEAGCDALVTRLAAINAGKKE